MSLLLQTTLRMPRLKPRFCSSGGDFQAKRFFVKLSSSRSQKNKIRSFILFDKVFCNNRNHLKRALSKSRPQSSRFEIPASRHPGYLFSLVYQTSCTSFADREICKIDKLSTFPHFLLSSRINPSSRQGPPAPHSPLHAIVVSAPHCAPAINGQTWKSIN